MEPEPPRAFGPFHFDGTQGRLWQGDQAIALRPQSLALPRYLVAHPGRLVTKAELRQHVWAGTHVTDEALQPCQLALCCIEERISTHVKHTLLTLHLL
jgi:DNA-binding winged helix-turn-helix (wHTH) protein